MVDIVLTRRSEQSKRCGTWGRAAERSERKIKLCNGKPKRSLKNSFMRFLNGRGFTEGKKKQLPKTAGKRKGKKVAPQPPLASLAHSSLTVVTESLRLDFGVRGKRAARAATRPVLLA